MDLEYFLFLKTSFRHACKLRETSFKFIITYICYEEYIFINQLYSNALTGSLSYHT